MRWSLFVCLFFLFGSGAQTIIRASEDSLQKSPVIMRDKPWCQYNAGLFFDLNTTINSTRLPASIPNAFVFKKPISPEQKESALKNLKSKNNTGAIIQGTIAYHWAPPLAWRSKVSQIGISYSFEQYLSTQYSSKLFGLVFQGNAPYAGQTIQIENENIQSIQFQTLKLHYLKNFKSTRLSVALGLALGNNLQQINLDYAQLYTEPDGSFIDMQLKGNMFSSNTQQRPLQHASAGPVFDLAYHYTLQKVQFDFQAENIGFIRWNSQAKTYSPDTSIHFTGIQVQDIFHFSTGETLADSTLENITGKPSQKGAIKALPARLKMRLFWQYQAGAGLEFSVSQLFFPGFKLQQRIAWHYELIKTAHNSMAIQLGLSHGGFGKLNSFVSLVPLHTRHHSVRIGTLLNEGWLIPKRLPGNGFVFSYHWTP